MTMVAHVGLEGEMGTFGGDGNVLYLNLGGCYTDVYTFKTH